MKAFRNVRERNAAGVAPLVGAWIERHWTINATLKHTVAPLVGAWIESSNRTLLRQQLPVAPLVGAWIESTPTVKGASRIEGRSSCRSVD